MKGEDDSINLSKERIGKTFVNKFGNIATCIEYNTNNDITIQFSNAECTQHTCWKKFSQGKFKSPFDPIKDGGIVGMMNVTKDKETKAAYETWRSMLKRCHSKLTHNNRPTYEKVECCDEWNYFPNFLKWLQSQENYSKWINSSSIWHLDKDILSSKDNKIYSPMTCVLVPSVVNELFVSCKASRGQCPIGVYYEKNSGKFKAKCRNPILNKTVNLGRYLNVEEAFQAYKHYKEDLIKQIAEQEYANENITQRCYEALLKYKVEITD